MESEVSLNDSLMQSLSTARIMKTDHKTDILAIEFSKDGTLLISCDESSINIYDTARGMKIKTLHNRLKKIETVRFTHNNEAILCATQADHKIYYWSIHDNDIIKIFNGHEQTILSLEINNIDDTFLSTSKDSFLKIWNLNSEDKDPDAILDLSGKNITNVIANFDPSGLVFAVSYLETIMSNSVSKMRLFDVGKLEDGSFCTWELENYEIKGIKFSNNGSYIICCTSENLIVLLDAFQGNLLKRFTSFQNENSLSIEACFTPDSKYILSGSENGFIHVWDIKSGNEIAKLEGHTAPSQCLKFSPTHVLLVSGCKNLVFWIPKK